MRGWLLPALLCTLAGCQPADRTNLLFISIDTLRADHVRAYGYERSTSPNLDRLAREGALFETMVAESSWTLPSHTTLFTGRSSRVHGVVHDGAKLGPQHPTLAERLRRAGYRTEGIASAPYLHPIFGFDRGFERYRVLGETVYDLEGFSRRRQATDPTWRRRSQEHDLASHRTVTSPDLVSHVGEALERLQDEPFFLFVHFFDAHFDYTPPEDYWRRFDPDYDGDFDPVGFATNPKVYPGMPREELEHVVARYDGEILWTDEHVGRVLDALDERGLSDRTLVVVVSDHGEEFFEHGRVGHRRTLFDEQLLVPFLMRLPGRIPAGRRLAMQTRMIDVLPTVLDLLELPPEPEDMGRSLLPYLLGHEPEEDLPALSYLRLPTRYSLVSLRRPEWKLVVRKGERAGVPDRARFYDLTADPDEREFRVEPEALAEALRELEALSAEEAAVLERTGGSGSLAVELPDSMRRALEALGYVQEEDASP